MFRKMFLLLLSGMLLVGSVSCHRSGCPANTEQQSSKKPKKSKSGVVPASYAQKKGLRSR